MVFGIVGFGPGGGMCGQPGFFLLRELPAGLDGQGVVVVEWADRFAELLPPETKWFLLKVTDDGARSVETALNPLG